VVTGPTKTWARRARLCRRDISFRLKSYRCIYWSCWSERPILARAEAEGKSRPRPAPVEGRALAGEAVFWR